MKKIFILSISIIFISIAASAQTKILKKGDLLDIPRSKQSTDLMSQESINKDSTLAKTNNGFDVKRSNIDNMVYLNTNSNNPSLNKMPIGRVSVPVEPMPTGDFLYKRNLSLKDTTIRFNSNDTLKIYKKH
jgi:hypothetical protein